jgi:cell wall-associated NlpC family hydrolase
MKIHHSSISSTIGAWNIAQENGRFSLGNLIFRFLYCHFLIMNILLSVANGDLWKDSYAIEIDIWGETMIKRVLSVLLLLTMALSLFSAPAMAAPDEQSADDTLPTAPSPLSEPAMAAPDVPSADDVLTMVLSLFTMPVVEAFDGLIPNDPFAFGACNENVLLLQTYLIANGFALAESGVYDEATAEAVEQYQASVGFEATGQVDDKTLDRLVRVEAFIEIAKSKLGTRYVRGGKGPNKFDCSGFVYWSLNQAGVEQGYMNSHAWQRCRKYTRIRSMKDLIRGDVLSFEGHVAIYLGQGRMIDASGSNRKVVIRTNSILQSSYWRRNFVAGFRVF